MEIETTSLDGGTFSKPVLSGLTRESMSYTFVESRGLLFSTQFAQPAILLLQKATFEDMRANGFIQDGATYAGHSLGEYGSLSAFSGFLSIRSLMDVVFYRGLTMQVSMERDEHGETNFSMVAANPKRVGKCMSFLPLSSASCRTI
jgi:fatty acid synthase subunit beta, fungi type